MKVYTCTSPSPSKHILIGEGILEGVYRRFSEGREWYLEEQIEPLSDRPETWRLTKQALGNTTELERVYQEYLLAHSSHPPKERADVTALKNVAKAVKALPSGGKKEINIQNALRQIQSALTELEGLI